MGPTSVFAFGLAGIALTPGARALAQRELDEPLSRSVTAAMSLALGMIGAVAAWRGGDLLGAAFTGCALAACVPIAVVDMADFRIPNRIVFPALAMTSAILGAEALFGHRSVARAFVGGVLFCGLLGAVHLGAPDKMGFGDVKLAALIGLPLGWQSLLAVPAALVAASVAGIVSHGVLVAAGRQRWGDILPFGVYLSLGTVVAIGIGGAALSAIVVRT